MDAVKYLNSQKGKIIEQMKVAYLSGKRILIIEKLDDKLLTEIIKDSSIIPHHVEAQSKGGLSYDNIPPSSVILCGTGEFIHNKIENFYDIPVMFVYRCNEIPKFNSPQISQGSSLPDISLNRFIEHLTGLSASCLEEIPARKYKALSDSIIVLVTNSALIVPERYLPYTEYITVPFIDKSEFSEIASVIISEAENIRLICGSSNGYMTFNKPDAEDFLRNLYDIMKGLGYQQINTILKKAKVKVGYLYSNNQELKNTLISFIRAEANKIIAISSSLSIIDTSKEIEPAGLDNITEWLSHNKDLIVNSSRYEFLEMKVPKGILVSGIPGTGKSMMAKFVAKQLELPLVRFDLGDLLGGYVGDSERNMRESLTTIDALAPCVVWVDEMEKAFTNSNSTHETTKRIIGKFLTWMQEKKSNSFVFATANDISYMPPEMFRSGRFDEKFYTFLPDAKMCGQIFERCIHEQIASHRKKTTNNLEAKPLFSNNLNADFFVQLINQEKLCIIEQQTFEDKEVTRKNKFFIGSDIAKIIEDAKSEYIREEGFTDSFDSIKFSNYLVAAIKTFKTYGETNLDDIAKCYSKLAHANFTCASSKQSVVLPFDGYNELNCSKGGDLYCFSPNKMNRYDQQMFISVRNTLNAFGKSLISR